MNIEDRNRNLENDMMLVRDRSLSPIEVKVGSFTCPAGTGNYSVTGVGFKPRGVEFIVSLTDAADRSRVSNGRMDYNGNQWAVATAQRIDTQTCKIYTVRCIQILTELQDSIVRAVYVSMDSNGFTINFNSTNTGYTVLWKAVR